MLNINTALRKLDENGKHICMGLVGAGQMGRGIVTQVFQMKGMCIPIIANRTVTKAKEAFQLAGVDSKDIIVTNTVSEAENAIKNGKYVVTEDFEVVAKVLPVDVIIEATGVPEIGAQVALKAIHNGKHIVMLNVEADATVGPILKKMADRAGIVYTVSAGDEPGAIKELFDFADAVGFNVIAVGKGKNNPLDRDATPDTLRQKALEKGVSPRMLTSFVDATNTMIELTAVSNAIGFVPSKRGLIGPSAKLQDLPKLFMLKEQGGILDRYQVVDYVFGIAPGVFAIVNSERQITRETMQYVSMGEGPNFVLYRPFHLICIETPLSAARAFLYKEPTIAPAGAPVSETVAVAKRDLKAGEHLDGIGGYTVYGLIDTVENARKDNAVPIGLINNNTVVKTDVKKGETITYDMVKLDEDSTVLQLRRLQDKFLR
ncbi:NAD(P)-dependent oxidoreductase [Tepidanaerobacter sp. GT38]|uniref:NAD(P)H-dependent oxidoreductase n=1 Tax=Tepidanaerobacter sp. GT38 TaxID=2722793 RepID=UPI001F3D67B3|nr:SAF domain-containing protein [Tepidanaerobacter sp. GT38]MCG1012023.1 NAD(P)-dependent oxidoreductase [Tepidanaerobacter sp. GT38]